MILIEENRIELAYKMALDGKSLTTISKELGITRRTLADRLYRDYGYINKRSKDQLERSLKEFEEIDSNALELYKNGMSLSEISKTLSIGRDALSKRMFYRHGITFENNKSLNVEYFKNINHESAYWLGYIQGDGCISNGIFEVSSKDKEHIELFKNCISSDHKIGEKNVNGESYWRLGILRKDFVMTLLNLGVTERKSYENTRFKLVDDEYIYSYLLGLFDSDGSVINHSKRSIQIGFTISRHNKQFLDEFVSFLNNINTNPKVYQVKERAYELRLNVDDSKKLVNLMYENSKVCLKRKYDKCKIVLPS